MKYVYHVCHVFNNKPAGCAGYFISKEQAERHAQKVGWQVPARVKRELASEEFYNKVKTDKRFNR